MSDWREESFNVCRITNGTIPEGSGFHRKVDLFFGNSIALRDKKNRLVQFLSSEEKESLGKIISDDVRDTYLASHASLRMVLSRLLDKEPLEIGYERGKYGKPFLPGNPVFFNMSHSRNFFAIGVSSEMEIGIDLEYIDSAMNFSQIIECYFSRKEQSFVNDTANNRADRFFMIWTRKESLMKTVGSGLVDNINKIEVSGLHNELFPGVFRDSGHKYDGFYIYSKRFQECYLSIAAASPITFRMNIIQSSFFTS